MLMNFNQPVIPVYSPISSRGGKRRRTRRRKFKSRRHNRSSSKAQTARLSPCPFGSKNSRTRRRYH